MTDKFPSYIKTFQYKGGFNKWVYDTLKKLSEGEDSNEESQTSSTKNISFIIQDSEGTGIRGANITLVKGNDSYSNGSNGTGSSGGSNINEIPYGEYTLTVSVVGYNTFEETVTIDENYPSSKTITLTEKVYYFTSYSDENATTEWGSGSVKETGVSSNGFTEVEVLTNDSDESFIGQKFYITSDAEPDSNNVYLLYTDAGSTSAEIYVKISTTE